MSLRTMVFVASLLAAVPAAAAEYGGKLEGFDYPHPVKTFAFENQGQSLEMAYMDVTPKKANGDTVLLLHGKNYCAATWESTITALADAGFRVVAVDQIGFCKSTKPERYQFTLHQLAANTRALLASLKIEKSHVLGHSMGGMLGARYALMYPDATGQLLLLNPIGLEDWKAMGVPWRSLDDWFAREKATTADGIRGYQREVYFSGDWKPEYDRWVEMLAGMYAGQDGERVAWNQAQTSDMVFTQPVVYEFPNIRVSTTLFIGQRDRTAIGRDLASPALRERLGDYPELGLRASRTIPYATLVPFEELGHSPHIEAPERFHSVLLAILRR